MKKHTTLRYLYSDANYEYNLEIIFTNDIKRSLAAVYKRWDIDEEVFDCEACVACCQGKDDKFSDTTKYAMLFKFDKLTNNVIAHECQHLAAFILDDRQIDLAGGNDDYENLAWLAGHLNEIVYCIVEKEKLDMYKTPIEPKLKKLK